MERGLDFSLYSQGRILTDFERRVEKWTSGQQSFVQKLIGKVAFIRHNKLPRNFRLFAILHWIAKFGPMVAAPSISYLVYDKITGVQAGLAIGVLFAIYLVTSYFDGRSSARKNAVQQASTEAWVRVGDLINSVKSSATPADKRDVSITASLGVIEAYARQATKSVKGEISVSLALYSNSEKTKMTIRHRNPGNERPVDRELKNLERVLGHIACRTGPEPRVVADLKKFGGDAYFSPTQSACNYRSMLLMPVVGAKTDQVVGFISVDCSRPHAFHDKIASQIVVTTEPMVAHIEDQY